MTIHFKLFKNILQYVRKFNNILLMLCFFSIKIFDNTKEILIKFLLRMEFALSAKLVYLLECAVDKNVLNFFFKSKLSLKENCKSTQMFFFFKVFFNLKNVR